MAIYTKVGDGGKTRLFSGEQVGKNNLRIEAYGSVDELNSLLGLARSLNDDSQTEALLKKLQYDLFTIGSELATVNHKGQGQTLLSPSKITELEHEIDKMEAELPKLANFIYPSGTKLAASLHVARSVCRRAERNVCTLMQEEPIEKTVQIYLNRLSDLLFCMARKANQKEGKEEIWQK